MTLTVFYQNVNLTRIRDPLADLKSLPVNQGEEIYVNVLIQHLASAYQAMQSDLTIKPEGVHEDIRNFFALPIPRFVWKKIRSLQNRQFVKFVDECLKE